MIKKFNVTGMTCSACAQHVERAAKKVDGVTRVEVNLLLNTMTVESESDTAEQVISAVERAGYGASEIGAKEKKETPTVKNEEQKKAWIRLWVSVGFLIPLMYVSMGHMIGLPLPSAFHGTQGAMIFALTQFLLCLPIIVINAKYYTVGFRTLFKGAPNMDTLIAVGSGAALVYGVIAMFCIGYGLGYGKTDIVDKYRMDLYFESAATILTLINVGKYLEARSKGKTSEAVTKLMDLSPKTAVVVDPDGTERTVGASELKVGDLIAVRAGSAIAADGVVEWGDAAVDESAVTGESIPSDKRTGSAVTGATSVKSGFIKVRVQRVGEDSTLSQIVRLVEEAGGSKAPIAKLADRVSRYFVPAVMCIALIAAIIWWSLGYGFAYGLTIGIAVLVISCPCALGLATPTAIMVGTGQGARLGILFKSAEVLENAHKITAVVLDKTGTITYGRPVVTDVFAALSDEKEFISLAASVEVNSDHPLAKAVVEYSDKTGVRTEPSEEFTMTEGGGISAKVGGKTVNAGNERLMKSCGVDISAVKSVTDAWAKSGKTPIYFARDGVLVGALALADTVKPSSRDAIERFKRMGLKVMMLTGDNADTAKAVADELGIEFTAEVFPADKERVIRELQASGHRVAMIGDGINDSPALARADIGIAIGAGTDIAIETADIVLMKSDLEDAATALDLSRATIRNIKENLFWAFFYNALCIPIAAGAFVPLGFKLNPMFAAAAMSLSSVCVVLNALRLRFFKPKGIAAADGISTQCSCNISPENGKGENIMERKVVLSVEGMTCNHCVAHVKKALEAIDGVTAVVDLGAKSATVTCHASVTDEMLKNAVTEEGYEVVGIE